MNQAAQSSVIPIAHRRKLSCDDIESLQAIQANPYPTGLDDQKSVADWCEKLIKFVQTYRTRLDKVLSLRFQGRNVAPLILDILVQQAWPERWSKLGEGIPDLRALNAALYFERLKHVGLSKALIELPSRLQYRERSWRPDIVAIPDFRKIETSPSESNTISQGPVVVLCPNHKSANTLSTLFQLNRLGIQVNHIFVRPLVSISRLREELRFSPSFLVKRVLNELVMPRFRSGSKDHANLSQYKQKIGCSWKNVNEAAKEIGARVHYFTNFNDDHCVDKLKEIAPEYGVFTGGGILTAKMLKTFRTGIVHAHPGVLPQYKGMDVVQWAIIEGNHKYVGSTCQLMSPKLDAGVLLGNSLVDIKKHKTLQSVRTAVVSDKIDLVCQTLRSIMDGRLSTSHAPLSGGNLYYLMHPKLAELSANFARTQLDLS